MVFEKTIKYTIHIRLTNIFIIVLICYAQIRSYCELNQSLVYSIDFGIFVKTFKVVVSIVRLSS